MVNGDAFRGYQHSGVNVAINVAMKRQISPYLMQVRIMYIMLNMVGLFLSS